MYDILCQHARGFPFAVTYVWVKLGILSHQDPKIHFFPHAASQVAIHHARNDSPIIRFDNHNCVREQGRDPARADLDLHWPPMSEVDCQRDGRAPGVHPAAVGRRPCHIVPRELFFLHVAVHVGDAAAHAVGLQHPENILALAPEEVQAEYHQAGDR